jgi:hypothetical protein
MATLTNTQISVTYVGLLKTSANTVLSSTAQQITDGSGNNSILFLSTAGVGIGGAAASGKELDVTGNVLVTGDLQVDNINIDGNTISSTAGTDLNITPLAGQQIVLDGTIVIDAGVVTGATSITSTAFVGALTGDVTGNADTATKIASITNSNIVQLTSSQTLTNKTIDLDNNTISNIEVDNLKSGVLDTDLSSVSGSDDTLASAKAIKTYVDAQVDTADTLSEILAIGNTSGANDILMADNQKVSFGAAPDFSIYHNATSNANIITSLLDRQLQITTNNLYVGNQAASETMITAVADGAVSLYHNNIEKLTTTTNGIYVKQDNGTPYINLRRDDSTIAAADDIGYINFEGDDPSDGTFNTGARILAQAEGNWSADHYISSLIFQTRATCANLATVLTLASNKLATFAGDVTIDAGASSTLNIYKDDAGNGKLSFYNDSTQQVFLLHDSAENFYIHAGSGSAMILSTNGATTLTLDTSNNAAFAGDISLADSKKAIFGAGSDLEIYHDGSNSYINETGTGSLITQTSAYFLRQGGTNNTNNAIVANTSVDLYYDNAKKFETTSTGVTVTGATNRFVVDSSSASAIDIGFISSARTIRAIETGGGNARPLTILAQDFTFKDDSATRLTIDSTSATFAGNVDSINGNGYRLKNAANSANESGFIRSGLWKGNTDRDPALFAETGLGLRFYAGGSANESLTIDSSGNSTFAGIVTTDKTFVAKGQNVSHGTSQIKISQENTTKSQIRFYGADTSTAGILEFTGSSSDGSVGGARVTINADGTTKFHANILVDVINNSANSANIIYRSGTSTLVGGGTTANKLYVLDNGNVGIGTTSPTHQMHIHTDNDNTYALRIQGSTDNGAGVWTGIGISGENANTKSAIIFQDIGVSYARGKLLFCVNNEQNQNSASPSDAKITISNDGNVGIGTMTPSVLLELQDSTHTTMKIKSGNNDNILFAQTIQSDEARIGTDTNTPLSFFTNTSRRMTITTSGNVGIGTTLPDMKLDVAGNIRARVAGNVAGGFYIGEGDTSEAFGLLSQGANGYFKIRDEANSADRFYISNTGNVGIGTTSPSRKITVSNAANGDIALFTNTSDADLNINLTSGVTLLSPSTGILALGTSNTERMRIDSSGNVLVGGSGTANVYLGNLISASSSNRGMRLHTNNADAFFDFQGGTGDSLFFRDYDGSGGIHNRFSFRLDNGSFIASGSVTQNGSPSDKKYKENIKTISNGIDKIEKLNPVEFDWNDKSDAHKIGKKEDAGFIAQEVQKVLPNLVNENVDGDLALNYEGIIPYLVQSIQELKKEIEILKNK